MINIRAARASDLSAVARLGAELVRQHHGFDSLRFMLFEPIEPGYEWFLRRELEHDAAIVLVAEESDGTIVGYAYGRLEERSYELLREACGALHDVFVAPAARRAGTGRALVVRMIEALSAKGAPRVVLHTATQNESAHALFRSLSFRTTMLEMTRESSGSLPPIPLAAPGALKEEED